MLSSSFLHNMASSLPALPLAGFWFGDPATTNAATVDGIFSVINWIALAFFVLIVGMMIVFLVKYRARPGHTSTPSPSHNNTLEIAWSVIPILLVALIFFLGFAAYMDMRTPPDDAYDIQVLASKWKFEFVYPDGTNSERLHIPPNQPVRLVQQSADVLHSLYIPAFRTKMDCVPGRYTYQWFEADKPGTYDLFCAEYCGKDHSNMNSVAIVHESEAAFVKAVEKENQRPEGELPWEWGEYLYTRKGCVSCHSIDGTNKAGGGPSWEGIWGRPEKLVTGETITVDENYVVESIRKPQAKVVEGFSGVNMAAYPESQLKPEEVDALIAYMKKLSGVELSVAPSGQSTDGQATDGQSTEGESTEGEAETPADEATQPSSEAEASEETETDDSEATADSQTESEPEAQSEPEVESESQAETEEDE